MQKIALIDGYGFVFRAYHSLPPLTRPDGTPVGAVFGFTNMLIKLLAGLDVSHIAIVFDSGSKTFRNEIYPKYKANRPPCPEDLKPQFPIIRQAAESLNLHILEKTGFEADDIIATIAKKSAAQGYEVLIISSDKDLMQLVDDHIFMYDAMKNKFIGKAEVKEKFLVEPQKVLDVLALIGDSSDNVPGVKGIGPKTAAELISRFDSLENLLANLTEIKQEKRRQLLIEGSENAMLSKKLITLKEDIELGINLSDLQTKSLDPHKFLSFLEEQGFRSLIAKVKNEFGIKNETNSKSETTKHYKKIDYKDVKKTALTTATAEKLYHDAAKNGLVTIDFLEQKNQLNFVTISSASFESQPREIFYFEVEESEKDVNTDLFNFSPDQHAQGLGLNVIEKILYDDSIKKIFYDAKGFFRCAKLESQNTTFDDLSLINHLTNSSIKNDLRELIDINLGVTTEFDEIFEEIRKEKTPEIFADQQKKIDFFCFKNFAIHEIYKLLHPQIFKLKLNTSYISYELPLLAVLAQMEINGIGVDVQKLQHLSQEFGKKISAVSKEIYKIAGEEFNIASPQQLSEILFTKLALDSSKKSKKTGTVSTGASVLADLEAEGNPIAGKILEFRKFSKLKNTYTDALPKEINPKTGRIHTTFSSISTITGRLSSSNPNLQNVPVKTAEGKKIRESFIAAKDHLLISADYSQIELRVIAHVAKIESLIAAFKQNKDIHKITASQVFKISEDKIDEETRSKAKAINFGIIYGISGFGLARQLGISRSEASDYIKSYLATYPGIDDYMTKSISFAQKNGYVETISGRKCFTYEINNKNPVIRQEAQRLAINAPIQGSAADIIKKAMIRLNKKFHEEKLPAKIILQIHDELLVEAPNHELELIKFYLKRGDGKRLHPASPAKSRYKIFISLGGE